ncbi:septation protein SepH [Pseudonocardia sp. T1-2H]|uniref:septation protein SepH n=2 Tax=unclassified Pseudonocardia TaxID=2619320 RepID=UPI0031010228
MRALRVVGITEDGSVVLEDPGRRERFTVPADEQLRAAARGDLTRLGQIAIELESQLRPREIQARIRAGASVEQVASAAGVPAQKIERFAYPVLLERTRTAEVARAAHPVRSDGPDVRTLGETVAHTFGLRGQDHTEADWDSWKGEDGKWVVALSWRAGRSDIRAHWTFQPGAHGGTVTALDEHASDLVEGLPQRPLRTVGPVIDIARSEEEQDRRQSEQARAEMVRAASGMGVRERPLGGSDTRSRSVAPEQRRPQPPRRPEPEPAPVEEPDEAAGAPAWNRAAPTGAVDAENEAAQRDQPAGGSSSSAQPADTSAAGDHPAATATGDRPVAEPAGVPPDLSEADPAPGEKPSAAASSRVGSFSGHRFRDGSGRDDLRRGYGGHSRLGVDPGGGDRPRAGRADRLRADRGDGLRADPGSRDRISGSTGNDEPLRAGNCGRGRGGPCHRHPCHRHPCRRGPCRRGPCRRGPCHRGPCHRGPGEAGSGVRHSGQAVPGPRGPCCRDPCRRDPCYQDPEHRSPDVEACRGREARG